jgi:uncharacterized protein YeaO (DUF488 family)
VLIDRLWPGGVRKADAAVERWMKDIARSAELRRWFGHNTERWQEFRRRYTAELHGHPLELDEFRELTRHRRVTPLFGAREEEHNDAVVLREVLLRS